MSQTISCYLSNGPGKIRGEVDNVAAKYPHSRQVT